MLAAAMDAPLFELAAGSKIGVGPARRAENQDNLLVIDGAGRASYLAGGQPACSQVAGWPPGHLRLAVMDGMGGHGHGREAAESVAAGLLAIPACADLDSLSRHLDGLHRRLQCSFDGLHEAGPRPGTTLTMLEIAPSGAPLLWHAGDSRLYDITAQAVVPLTVDHVPATVLAMAGLLGEESWWRQVHGSHTPQIAQAFILGNTLFDPSHLDDGLVALDAATLPPWLRALPDRRVLHLRPGAIYLLATDGFWSCSDPAEFVARWPRLFAGKDAPACLDALFGEIAERPPVGLQPDNLSAIVLRVRAPGHDETALPQGA
ncbi:protein phosphatase [Massilia sp. CFBP 13647]|nr:protein phosphatase [Massilia sp. CFBP 13647]MBD8673776.1 protein phosphatase [Massilia sp. CFBP 13721]